MGLKPCCSWNTFLIGIMNWKSWIFGYSSSSNRFQSILILILLISNLILFCLYTFGSFTSISGNQPSCPWVWHGGSPNTPGSCWCSGIDSYCLCTPSLAVDAIIEYHPGEQLDPTCKTCQLLFVVRNQPPRNFMAITGGFVDIGEPVEMAVLREVKEETNLTITCPEQFKLFSDPTRDKRRHTASIVFRCYTHSVEYLHQGDDAKQTTLIPINEALNTKNSYAFDHKTIVYEYIHHYYPHILDSLAP